MYIKKQNTITADIITDFSKVYFNPNLDFDNNIK